MQLREPRFGSLGNHLAAFFMHLLYLDDSGSVGNLGEDYLVLAGISMYETQAYHLSNELDKIAESINPQNPSDVEFHASEIFARRTAPWNGMSRDDVKNVLKQVLKLVADSANTTYLFACAIHKSSFDGLDPMKLAFEDLCQRFNSYLAKVNADGDRQKGLLILDESSYETSLQELAKNFRKIGTQWGSVKHLADIPFFVNSKASRIIQIADHVAYSVFRRYNSGDTQYFDIIAHKFFQSDSIVHGLAHKQKVNYSCMCLACASRKNSKNTLNGEIQF